MTRLIRHAAAAMLGAAGWAALLAVALLLFAPVSRIAAGYFVRGTVDIFPVAQYSLKGKPQPVDVRNASPAEVQSIQNALAEIGLDRTGEKVTFRVVDTAADPGEVGSYIPLVDLIDVRRDVVRMGGGELRWTLGHEMGHYADRHYLTDADRTTFKALRGIPAHLNWFASDEPWRERPIEDFAEVFSAMVQPDVERIVATAYGQVRNPARFEPILTDAGLGRTPRVVTFPEMLQRDVEYMLDRFDAPRHRKLIGVIAGLFALYGFVEGWAYGPRPPPRHLTSGSGIAGSGIKRREYLLEERRRWPWSTSYRNSPTRKTLSRPTSRRRRSPTTTTSTTRRTWRS